MKITIETTLDRLYIILTATGNPELAMSLLDGGSMPTVPTHSSYAGRPAELTSVDFFKNEVKYTLRDGFYITEKGEVYNTDYYGGRLSYLSVRGMSRNNTMTVEEWQRNADKAIPNLPEIESKEDLMVLLNNQKNKTDEISNSSVMI